MAEWHGWLCAQVIELPIKHPELFESLGVAQPKVRRALPWKHLYTFSDGEELCNQRGPD